MDLKRKLIGALFAVVASSGLLIACGNDENSCEFDTDCLEGEELCHDGFCEPVCTSQSDCFDGEVCVDRIGGSGKVCVSEGISGNNGDNNGDQPECTDNDECESGLCNQDTGLCVDTTAPTYFTVMVRDSTTDPGRCADTTGTYNSAGTKLTYIALRDSSGANIGYGKEIGYLLGDNSDYDDVSGILDGSAPNLTNQCVESFELDTGVALGCGGWVMVQFYNSDGERIALTEEHDVFVGVHGQYCDTRFDKDGLDKYDVALCTTVKLTDLENDTCTVSLETGINGLKPVGIELP